MIKNERQYKITKTALAKLKDGRDQLDGITDRPEDILELEKDSFDRKITDLQDELEEYGRLKDGKIPVMEILSINDLPEALIKARIALGLSQKELAQKVGLKEQQIQRYEHTDYESAKLSRIREIFDVLRSEKTRQDIPEFDYDLRYVFKRLSDIGLDRNFIKARFVPKHTIDEENIPDKLRCLQVASRVGRVFDWSSSQVLNKTPLVVEPMPAKFKISRKYNKPKLGAHRKYAHYITGLLSETTRHLEEKAVPESPDAVRDAVADSSLDITFKGILEYVWKMGIPVIAIGPLSFHAACMKNGSKNTIVLAQKTKSEARWMFNLLHELYHVIKGMESMEIEDVLRSSQSKEEQEANRFAHTVLLGDRERLLESCLNESGNGNEVNPAYLKKTVIKVARRNDVRADVLANYVAYRLWSDSAFNWWGAAQNLQEPADEMRAMVRDAVLENTDLDLLNKPDLELMLQALRMDDES